MQKNKMDLDLTKVSELYGEENAHFYSIKYFVKS